MRYNLNLTICEHFEVRSIKLSKTVKLRPGNLLSRLIFMQMLSAVTPTLCLHI